MTQEEVVELILKIAKKHAKKREFDIYDDDDIVQECYLIAVDVLEKYDGSYPIENFLRVCILNRLINLYRKKTRIISFEHIGDRPIDSILVDNYDYESEVDDIIDNNLDSNLREDFLKFRNGIKLSRTREANLISHLKEILEDYWRDKSER